MTTASRCGPVEFSRADTQRSAAWMIGLSLGLVALYFVLDRVLGQHIMIEALLYSTFSIAFTVSSRNTYLRPYSRAARNGIMILSVLGWYAFFLAVTALAAVI